MSLFHRGLKLSIICRFGRYFSGSSSTLDETVIRNKFRQLKGDTNGDVELCKTLVNEQQIAVIKLKNPQRKNAFTGSMMVKLAEIVDELEAWTEGKALILAGDGGFFCSGGDMKFMISEIFTPEDGNEMCFLMQRCLTRLSRLPLISVAAVEGKALGGGAEVATACDFIVMSEDAEISFVQSRMGLSTGWGGGSRLVNLLGQRKALELLLLRTKLDAKSSVDIGLVNAALPKGKDIVTSAAEWLLPYLDTPTPVLRAIKRGAVGSSFILDKALVEERLAFIETWSRKHHKEALSLQMKHK